jgi:hypothetical protein
MSAASFLEAVHQNGGKNYFDAVGFSSLEIPMSVSISAAKCGGLIVTGRGRRKAI